MRQFFTSISLEQNELESFAIHNLSSDPTPVTGQMWFNTTTSQLKYYNGTTTVIIASLADIAGGVTFKGGYDAAANTPDLDTTPIAVLQGDMYTVTVAGTFFTEPLQVGDSIIAKVDSASTLADWTIVQGNVVEASETVAGVIEIATTAEVTAGTDDARAVTPLKLEQKLAAYAGILTVTSTEDTNLQFAIGADSATIAHNFNRRPVQVVVMNEADNELVDVDVAYPTVNTVLLTKSGPAFNATVTIIG